MCNAKNHPFNCTCGWGGTGHSGKSSSPYPPYLFPDIPIIAGKHKSFVNPNARCSVCGEVVFFYQAPSGGRVFFDILGPPWPRHPCTDNSHFPLKLITQNPDAIKFDWQIENWQPFMIDAVTDFDRGVFRLIGSFNDEEFSFYVGKNEQSKTINAGCIAHMKKLHDFNFLLSIVTANLELIDVRGYTFISDVVTALPRENKLRKMQRKNIKKLTRSNQSMSKNKRNRARVIK
ncbi:hypothetical protein ATG98_0952 [Marinobacter sp. LV10R520-4]|uniref:hypothetical protein n=1 Tax=Marinobacter sp. LV10R520-4 TaxID=1761796 RepID=UPI000C003F28|nr:hypothetical protein [Marinobacter sp. LV10R520-4]PFG51969.1 hypothetical protein ATG98_0952 [Marinobacter sp. LV10R520-4]